VITNGNKRERVIFAGCGTNWGSFQGRLYGLEAFEAMELCQRYHDTREDIKKKPNADFDSPQTHDQKSQVYKLLSQLSLKS